MNGAISRSLTGPPPTAPVGTGAVADFEATLAARLRPLDEEGLRREFAEAGGFIHLEQFLPPELTARLVAAAAVADGSINRNYLPGHKQGGSVSRHTLDDVAPFVGQLYRSPALIAWLGRLSGESLQVSPAGDPHAYALYFYSREGDHIGWHYDTSYYYGRRYTLLLGVLDDSSCRLEYQLHTREPGVASHSGSLRLDPGALVFFDGDKLRHRITPSRAGELRVSLTFEYVTDPRMNAGWRLISNLKDAVAYFGLRQVFGRRSADAARRPPSSARRAAALLLSAGLLLFLGLLVSRGLPAILATLSLAGWGLLGVALFHLLPLLLDAAAIRVLFDPAVPSGTMRDALLARWVGESANSLLPAGQIGGPVWMSRHLVRRGMTWPAAAAAITVSTTLQSFAQITFALLGVLLLSVETGHLSGHMLRDSCLIASGVLTVQLCGFYWLQRRGLFGRLSRLAARFSGKRDWSRMASRAEGIDLAVAATYGRVGPVWSSFALGLVGWLVGAGEVFLILQMIGTPVTWVIALLLESLGQAIRGAAFAIPGALGVQEGGYLLLAPLAGLSPDTALALSLGKRARELLLGVPGLLYLHFFGRGVAGPADSSAG